jgi:phosphoglycolate phosphatase-like HAD superfamily hydrolase
MTNARSVLLTLWDIDKTLLTQEGSAVPTGYKTYDEAASARMFKEVFGVEAHEGNIKNQGKTEKQIITEVMALVAPDVELTDELLAQAFMSWAHHLEEILQRVETLILPGIEEMLAVLSDIPEIKLSLLTGNSPHRSMVKLEQAGLSRYFVDKEKATLETSTPALHGAFGSMAPNRPALLEHARQNIAEPNQKIVIIDDSLIGAEMARNQGVPAIMVGTGGMSLDTLREHTEHVFPDFGEERWRHVVELLKGMTK